MRQDQDFTFQLISSGWFNKQEIPSKNRIDTLHAFRAWTP